MRHWLAASVSVVALVLAGCSKSGESTSSSDQTGNPPRSSSAGMAPPAMREASGDAAPGVDVTAAPGVAFTYRYAFRLPAMKLAAAQETHAAACEKLGIARCRITGMHYRVLGENSREGSIRFKLDPAIARSFGKQGIDSITAAEGQLIDAEITGTDAGAEIARQRGLRAAADAELARIDKELARKDLSDDERATLRQQRAELVRRIAEAKDTAGQQTEALANTPVEFAYETGPAVQGFDGSAPIKSAANVFVGSVTVTIGFVLTLLAALAPPGVVVLGVWLLWRRFRPRRARVAATDTTPA